MSDDERCPECDGEPDDVVILSSFGGWSRRIPRFTCCVPPPTPAELRRKAEDDWLRRQRELAAAE
jgi:hypothetical protein